MNNNFDALHIEGTLRFQDNIKKVLNSNNEIIANIERSTYGKYFSPHMEKNNESYHVECMILVSENGLILGKPRHQQYFTHNKYKIKLTQLEKGFPYYIFVMHPLYSYYINKENDSLFKYPVQINFKGGKRKKCRICRQKNKCTRVISWSTVDYFCNKCFIDQ